VEWCFIRGGICLYGDKRRPIAVPDLWCSRTPVTAADVSGDRFVLLPVRGLTSTEALELAERFEGTLPSSVEWEWIAGGAESRLYPWGNEDWSPSRANLRPSGLQKVVDVGCFPLGATPEGVLDLAGNCWEWTRSSVPSGGMIVRGGSYDSLPLYARVKFLNAAPRELRSQGIGIRVITYSSPREAKPDS
jgi:sulfatase modifying factor 1